MTDQDLPGLDVPRVGARLAEAWGDERWRSMSARLIAGGKSNLTYRLRSEAGTVVLRRPPTGHLLPKAHDMGREARVQRALAETSVPVPEVLHEEATDEINGAPFYVMADVPGHVITGTLPDGYADGAEQRVAMGHALIDTLVDLHAVDVEQVGLGDYGRPDGFMKRQVATWTKQWELSRGEDDAPVVDELSRRLDADVPEAQATAIVHGDYRLDNCLMQLDDPGRVAAVLDWELSTIGDPLADLGMTLFYWGSAATPMVRLVPSVVGQEGFPSAEALAVRYAERSGRDVTRLTYYLAFAHLKFAVIAQGVKMRAQGGAMGGQTFDDMGDLVPSLAARGLSLLEGR